MKQVWVALEQEQPRWLIKHDMLHTLSNRRNCAILLFSSFAKAQPFQISSLFKFEFQNSPEFCRSNRPHCRANDGIRYGIWHWTVWSTLACLRTQSGCVRPLQGESPSVIPSVRPLSSRTLLANQPWWRIVSRTHSRWLQQPRNKKGKV